MGTVAYRSRFTTEPSLNLGCSSTLSHWIWTCLRYGDGLGGWGMAAAVTNTVSDGTGLYLLVSHLVFSLLKPQS